MCYRKLSYAWLHFQIAKISRRGVLILYPHQKYHLIIPENRRVRPRPCLPTLGAGDQQPCLSVQPPVVSHCHWLGTEPLRQKCETHAARKYLNQWLVVLWVFAFQLFCYRSKSFSPRFLSWKFPNLQIISKSTVNTHIPFIKINLLLIFCHMCSINRVFPETFELCIGHFTPQYFSNRELSLILLLEINISLRTFFYITAMLLHQEI